MGNQSSEMGGRRKDKIQNGLLMQKRMYPIGLPLKFRRKVTRSHRPCTVHVGISSIAHFQHFQPGNTKNLISEKREKKNVEYWGVRDYVSSEIRR